MLQSFSKVSGHVWIVKICKLTLSSVYICLIIYTRTCNWVFESSKLLTKHILITQKRNSMQTISKSNWPAGSGFDWIIMIHQRKPSTNLVKLYKHIILHWISLNMTRQMFCSLHPASKRFARAIKYNFVNFWKPGENRKTVVNSVKPAQGLYSKVAWPPGVATKLLIIVSMFNRSGRSSRHLARTFMELCWR